MSKCPLCPLCGNPPTEFERVAAHNQKCINPACELPVKLWDKIAAIQADTSGKYVADVHGWEEIKKANADRPSSGPDANSLRPY